MAKSDAVNNAVFLIVIAATVLVLAGVLCLPPVKAQPRLTWQQVGCETNKCIADILNALPSERAAEAKLTTWGNLTYVWYRK